MLYGIGVTILFLSVVFADGSILASVAVASVGVALMMIGRRPEEDEERTRV